MDVYQKYGSVIKLSTAKIRGNFFCTYITNVIQIQWLVFVLVFIILIHCICHLTFIETFLSLQR